MNGVLPRPLDTDASDCAGAPLPPVERVDAQPLLLPTQRLAEALDAVGAPLPAETASKLAALKQETDEAKITGEVQRLLDPQCVAAVEIAADGALKPSAAQGVEVEENGWKTMLVKVVNRSGVQSRLRVASPNARPIPHGPKEEIASRWMRHHSGPTSNITTGRRLWIVCNRKPVSPLTQPSASPRVSEGNLWSDGSTLENT